MKSHTYVFLVIILFSNFIQSQELKKNNLLKEIDEFYDRERKYPKKITYKDFDLNVVIEEVINIDGELISSFHFDPNTGKKNGAFKFLSSKYYYDNEKVWNLSEFILDKEKHYNQGVYNQGLMNSSDFEILIRNRNNGNSSSNYILLKTSVINGKFDDELRFYSIDYQKPKYILDEQNKLKGSFIGIQDRYQLLNKYGELMFIYGEPVIIEETEWQFSFEENNEVSLIAYNDGLKLYYQGSYYLKEDENDRITFQADLSGEEDSYSFTINYHKKTGELICSDGNKASKDFVLEDISMRELPWYYFKKDLISTIPIQKGKINDGVYSYDEFTQVYFKQGAIIGLINKNDKNQTLDSLFRQEKIWKIKERYKKNNGVYRGPVFDPITYYNKIQNTNRSLVAVEYAEGYQGYPSIRGLRGDESLFSQFDENASEDYYSLISQEYNILESELGTFFSYQNDLPETLSLIRKKEEEDISYEQILIEFKEKGIEVSAQFQEKFRTDFQSHIRRNFRYPDIAQEKRIQGEVRFKAVLSKEGKFIDIRFQGVQDENLRREALRLLEGFSGDPYYFNGGPVFLPYSNSITFRL